MLDDGQIFQQPVLDLAHAVVVPIEYLAGAVKVDLPGCLHAPGQVEHRFDIRLQNGTLRRVDGGARKARKLLFRALAGFSVDLGIAQARAQFAQLLVFVFAQFFLNGVDLFAQVVVVVGLVHGFAHARVYLLFQSADLQIARERHQQRFQPEVDRDALQHRLFVGDIGKEIGRHHVAEGVGAFLSVQLSAQLAGYALAARLDQRQRLAAYGAHHRLTADEHLAVFIRGGAIVTLKRHKLGALHVAALLHVQQDGAAFALDKHAHGVVRHAQNMTDVHHRAHGVHILKVRCVHACVALGDHEQPPVARQRALQRRHGAAPGHVQRHHRIGKGEQPAQGQKRQPGGRRLFFTGLTHTARPLRLILFIIQTYR